MFRQRIIGYVLFSFILLNAAISGAGVLQLCAHDSGETHLFDKAVEDCHAHDAEEQEFVGHCDDLELTAVDLISVREEPLILGAPTAQCLVVTTAFNSPAFQLQHSLASTRGPPASLSQSVLVARHSVLRL